MRISTSLCIAMWAILLCGCAGLFFTSTACEDIVTEILSAPSDATVAGTHWMYQLQEADPIAISATTFDIVVMDYSRDGSVEGRYSPEDLATIRETGGARQVLCYFSIGEAEDYRGYFDEGWVSGSGGQPVDEAPCWLGRTNPEWAGNYKVQYWSQAWQDILLAYLDDIIDAGFNGVYLDIIDAYEYWADEDNREGLVVAETDAAARMIALVCRIAHHARIDREVDDFLVFPQNGEPLLAYDDDGDYLATISGIGIEDLYFDEDSPIATATTEYRMAFLDQIAAVGKRVIVVDYVDDGSEEAENIARIEDFRELALGDGYLPYAALMDRALDEINTRVGQP